MHIPPPGRNSKVPPKERNVDLIQVASTERAEYFDKKQNGVLRGLNRVKEAASDIRLAIQLFQETDEDGSGELDKEELGNLMKRMGLQMSDKRLTEVQWGCCSLSCSETAGALSSPIFPWFYLSVSICR